MYRDMKSTVKWDGLLSESFVEAQGVRQGGIPSTELFKARCNGLLNTLESSSLGFRIGTTSVAAPTCADDMTIISSSPTNLQLMLDLASQYASSNRYTYNAIKSTTMIFNAPRTINAWRNSEWWSLDLGLIRTPDGKATATVESNISKAK